MQERAKPKGKPRGGSRKGKPNRVTADVRASFALLLGNNVGKMQGWLMDVAEGLKEPIKNKLGEVVKDEKGNELWRWLRQPDPGYAMKLMSELAEYHIPKLARTELAGELQLRGSLTIRDD